MPLASTFVLALLGAAAASALLTALVLVYARRRQLLDLPGRRRSHAVPTPRGGGAGAVAVIAAAAIVLGWAGAIETREAWALAAGLAAIGTIGWIDDHRPLSARLRLAVHVLVGAALAAVFLPGIGGWQDVATAALVVFALTTSINAWNFMDGIDGLVATQTAWVGVLAMCAFALAGEAGWGLLAACVAAAALGFLPFNFPRARIFMGDVGSGGLGLACGALLLVACLRGAASPWLALLAASALLGDATLTLAHRFLRRRRWYAAHREHLYQWMVRSGTAHARTTMAYLGWNFVVVLPLLVVGWRYPAVAPMCAVAAASIAVLLWYGGKRAILRRTEGAA